MLDISFAWQGQAPLPAPRIDWTLAADSSWQRQQARSSTLKTSTDRGSYIGRCCQLPAIIMALHQREPYTTADAQKIEQDESDREEEALAADYKEQVQFDDGMNELDRTGSLGIGGPQDMQAQLAAAATPLEYGAALDTKFASYDNYCNLFHYILNSEGPVDLEVPTVSFHV